MSNEMSKEAQELVKLVGVPGVDGRESVTELSQVLKDHPELLAGLDEYTKWRDQQNVAVGRSQKTVPLAHGVSGIVDSLKKGKKKVRK